MRVLYFGMAGYFSARPLQRLIEGGAEVCGVVVPADEAGAGRVELGPGAIALQPSAFSLAGSGLPLIQVSGLRETRTLDRLAALRPDVICTACFPHLFPPALLGLPPLGCLNLHPSLLPRYRGPAPLFRQFRQGETHTGVTAHFMERQADAGPVALQRPVAFADGISGAQADALCAEAGAELLLGALDLLAAGRCPRVPQDTLGKPSAAPWPGPDDFTLDAGWTARRAFNFMRGTAHWGRPYEIVLGEARLTVQQARSFTRGEALRRLWREEGDALAVQFADGVVRAVKVREPEE